MCKERHNNRYEIRKTAFDLMTSCIDNLDPYNDIRWEMLTLEESVHTPETSKFVSNLPRSKNVTYI